VSTLPVPALLVQSLADALRPTLAPLLRDLPLAAFVRGDDRSVRDALLSAAALVVSESLSQPERPDHAVARRRLSLHSALGVVHLVRWVTRDEQGRWHEPLDGTLVRHGCTVAVREQINVLHALGTTHETRLALSFSLPEGPSLATIHRVAVDDGVALAKAFSPALLESLLAQKVAEFDEPVDLLVAGADGGFVPMRGDGRGEREWHEGRVVTVTMLGAPDADKPRQLSLFDEPRRWLDAGGQRRVLATVVLGQMPTLDGPRSERVEKALTTAVTALGKVCSQACWQGLSDGGEWPEKVLDASVGRARRTTDFFHTSDHLKDAAEGRLGRGDEATAWWARERTALLTEVGAAGKLATRLAKYGERPGRCHDVAVVRKEAGYVGKRVDTMAYAERLARNEVIGSGHTEAAIKQVITTRMKRTGANWSHRGGEAVMHARSLVVSGLWKGAWAAYVTPPEAPRQAAA
jgi:hypothetical protein